MSLAGKENLDPVDSIRVEIVRWVDEYQPGIVECRLTDRMGRIWLFHEKLPIVSLESLDRDRLYPRPGILACRIVAFGLDESGRRVAEITRKRRGASHPSMG